MLENHIEWQPSETRATDRSRWPGRQFVLLDGERHHSDFTWARKGWGVLSVHGKTSHGYSEDQWNALCSQLDMDPDTAEVTHWAPAAVNWPTR